MSFKACLLAAALLLPVSLRADCEDPTAPRTASVDLSGLLGESKLRKLATRYPGLKIGPIVMKKTEISGDFRLSVWNEIQTDLLYLSFCTIPNDNVTNRFDNFQAAVGSDEATALAAARALISGNHAKSFGLFLWGKAGSGKSHLGFATARSMFDRMMSELYPSGTFLHLRWEDAMLLPTGDDLVRKLMSYKFVLIDDVNGFKHEHDRQIFKDILGFLYETGGRRVIMTSNADPEQLFNMAFALDTVNRERYWTRFTNIFLRFQFTGPVLRQEASLADLLGDAAP